MIHTKLKEHYIHTLNLSINEFMLMVWDLIIPSSQYIDMLGMRFQVADRVETLLIE